MTEPSNIVGGLDLNKLGEGSALLLWAFRSCACGWTKCSCLPAMFDHHFGEQGPDVLRHILVLAQVIGSGGHRKITLVNPNSARVTHDEASLLRSVEAVQNGHVASLSAQMTWLMAGGSITVPSWAVSSIAKAFAQKGLFVRSKCESLKEAVQNGPELKGKKSLR
ncbi:MAG: hypothetical protein AAFP97_01580 [Pseudomonadota bacterium]